MADDQAQTRGRIREFVLENLALGKGITCVSDEESLVESGVVDSLGIFQLVAFLEGTFGISVGDEEITHENFLTISAIELFVATRLAASRPRG